MYRLLLNKMIICIWGFLGLFSCEIQELNTNLGSEGASYLESHFTPPIMFHYSHIDDAAGIYSGWFIDNRGNVRSYISDSQVLVKRGQEISKESMESLTQLSKPLPIQIDLSELVEAYKKNIKAAEGELRQIAENSNSNLQVSFYAYAISYSNTQTSDASDCPVGRSSSSQFRQVLLSAEGKTSILNESTQAKSLMRWLKRIHESV